MGAKQGNNYAKKENPKSAIVHLRIEPALKNAANFQAEQLGISLSAYICRLLKSDLGK